MHPERTIKVVLMAKLPVSASKIVVVLLVFYLVGISAEKGQKTCINKCLNGNCDSNERCVCDPCWNGIDCNVYDDQHRPHFKQKHSKLYLTRGHLSANKPIFTAEAVDRDILKCHGKACPCGDIDFKLINQLDFEYFKIDPTTGQLYIVDPSKLVDDRLYELTAVALSRSPKSQTNLTITPIDDSAKLRITILIQKQTARIKRDITGKKTENIPKGAETSTPISFSLRTVFGEVSTLQVGNSIHYRLEIALPRASVDLILEIHTRDSNTGNKSIPALSLYNFTIPQRIPSISYNTPEPKFFLSNKSKNVFDKVFVDFGSIKNTGPERNILSLYFSVVLTRKITKSETKHTVFVGAEYNNGGMAWVAQSQITTTSLSQSDDQINLNVEFNKLPPKLSLDSAALIRMNANLEFRSDNFAIEITSPSFEYEPDNLISLGRISVVRFGKSYLAIPNVPAHYGAYRNKTISLVAFSRSILEMEVITNVGEKSRSFTNNPDNIIEFEFPVYALNFKENVGKNASLTIKFFFGNKNLWTKTLSLAIVERKQERSISKMISSMGQFSNYNVSKGGLTQLKVKSGFLESESFVDYSLMIEVPTSQRMPLFVPCSAKFINEESGFNIPYLNGLSIKPTEDSNTFTFEFGRIHFLSQRNTSTAEDNSVVTEITFRVPFHDEISEGTTLYANVKAMSGSKTLKVDIPSNEVMVYSENRSAQIELTTNRSVSWNDLIVNGGIAVNVDIELPINSAYQTFKISAQKDETVPDLPELNICKFKVIKIGSDVPCSCVQLDDLNANRTQYMHLGGTKNSSSYDHAIIDFNSIAVTNRHSDSYKRKLSTNIVAMIKQTDEALLSYPVKVDVIADDQLIWSEKIEFSISKSDTLSDNIRNLQPELNFKLMDQTITPGFTTNIMLEVVTLPNTLGPFTIEVISNDEELSVCGLWVHSIGDNMPCINKEQEASYESVFYGQNNKARLEFDMITNFGSNFRQSEYDEKRANTLEFIAMVRVNEAAKTNQAVKIIITHGYKKNVVEKELVVPVNSASNVLTEFKKPKVFEIKSADDTNLAYAGIPKLIYYDIELEENTQIPISILMESSNEYKFCSSAFVKIGKNYPCYSPNSLRVSSSKFELGMLCNTYLHKNSGDNLMRLAVALRPNKDLVIDRVFKIASLAYIGKTPYNKKHELMMTVAEHYNEENDLTKGATVHAEVRDNIHIKIRERKWIAFNVRIPPMSTGKLLVVAQGEADESRAIVVMHDLRIVSGGANIPCPLENGNFKIQHSSSVPTNQKNILSADLNYFSNFGFSYHMPGKNDSDKIQDDFLKIEVLAELTDHPAIVDDSAYEITFTTYYGNQSNPIVREGKAKLIRVLEGATSPKIDVNIKLKKKLNVLDRGDFLTMIASFKHLPESNAEPTNSVLRLFFPEFVELIQIDSANTPELPTLINNTDGSTDITFPWILFSDEIVLNFTIQMDPKNLRGYGQDEITIISPYRMLCEHPRMSGYFKTPCSQLKYINFRSKSSECNLPLGMESGDILDEQISASSAISGDHAPENARPNLPKYWSPAIKNWNSEHYLQIDFRRKTRVVRLTFKSIRGLRRVASMHLTYSQDGRLWDRVNNPIRIIYNDDNGELVIKKPVEARYYRIVLDEIESNLKTKNQYIAVRLELHGCYLEEEIANQTSIVESLTHFTDDPAIINRHIAVDPYTNVLYFCDTANDNNHQMCYYSASGGQTWDIIGKSIDSIEGFELATGKFFAIDYQRPAYFSSADGSNWTPIDFDEYNATVTHFKFHKKIVVPQFHKDDIHKMDLRVGNWRVSYDGLYHDDSQKAKAFWKNCCGLD